MSASGSRGHTSNHARLTALWERCRRQDIVLFASASIHLNQPPSRRNSCYRLVVKPFSWCSARASCLHRNCVAAALGLVVRRREPEPRSVDPHAVHDHCELARDRNDRTLVTALSRDLHAPSFKRAVLLRAREHAARRLVERGSNLAVAAPRDMSVAVDRGARLLALGRQPEVRAQRLRLGEAVGSSTAAMNVIAVTGPTPGISHQRRHSSSWPTS